jgi:hypothetical protein
MMRWVGQEESMGDKITRLKHKMFAGKPKVEDPFGRVRVDWENNIMLDLGETMWERVDWIHLAQERIMAGSSKHDNGHSTIDGTFDLLSGCND